MQQEINLNEIVKIETLPKIFEQLDLIGKMVDESLEGIEDIECTEENKQSVKAKRTEINNTLAVLENKRKEIKKAISEPYELFNKKYEETTKKKLENASESLKNKILDIEIQQKKEKEDELRAFAEQWFYSKSIEKIVKFEDIGLNITLSASVKSLKEQVVTFCERIFNEMSVIESMEDKKEVLYEYKNNGFNLANAIKTVNDRKEAYEALKKDLEKIEEKELNTKEILSVAEPIEDEITAPVEIIENEEIVTVTFTITDTKENIIKVREFMKLNNVKYE